MNPLQRDIIEPLRGIIGAELSNVVYRTLQSECAPDEITNPDFYIGGEVEMKFSDRSVRYFSWAERAGFESHFTFKVSPASHFSGGALADYGAGTTPLWRDALGSRFRGFKCYGWEGSPHVLHLDFEGSAILIGSSYQTRFGDGDDVFFCPASASEREIEGADILWESTNGEHVEGGNASPATS